MVDDLREVGVTLLEDTSHEACGVEVLDLGKVTRCALGCLGGDQKNQDLISNSHCWCSLRPLFLGPIAQIQLAIVRSMFFGFFK